jgi:hypothetical protein
LRQDCFCPSISLEQEQRCLNLQGIFNPLTSRHCLSTAQLRAKVSLFDEVSSFAPEVRIGGGATDVPVMLRRLAFRQKWILLPSI